MLVAQGQVPIKFLLSVLLHFSYTSQAITWCSMFNYIVKCLGFVMGILSLQTICHLMNSSGNCLNQGSVLSDYYSSELLPKKPDFSTTQMLRCMYAYTRPSE